ncbi:MAG: FAD-dependent oxidoreductase [Acetatifactor sp.]|jgi:glycine/D-amino acid oxidase-like deaminating enzyme|nr:FAD-dependent oxidoreductase [Acetatifactor sp.]
MEKYDVIVAGGGPAGVAAAIAAAENGAKTLLIEKYGFLGGTPINASVPVFCPYSDKNKAIIGGIGIRILRGMQKETWRNPIQEKDNGLVDLDWVVIDPEVLKRVLDRMVSESGAALLLHTVVTGVEKEGDRISRITTYSKSGVQMYSAECFIDCTGDADLVGLAGGEYELGDDAGKVQGLTLCMRLGGVDGEKFNEYKQVTDEDGNLHVAVARAKACGDFPLGEKEVATFVLQNRDCAGVNFGHIYDVNPLDVKGLTAAEISAREKSLELLDFFKKYVPGFENSYILSTGPAIGVRESRRIVGEYRLTRQDYYEQREFEDAIARYAYPIDVHAVEQKKDPDGEDEFVSSAYPAGASYTIPYRALLPKQLSNVIVAGRSLASDRAINGSARVAPACFAMGQAAGTAAALSVRDKVGVKNIDVSKLRQMLTEQGACL